MTMNPAELKGALEAIIYAADEPATLEQIANAIDVEKQVVQAALDDLIASVRFDGVVPASGGPTDCDAPFPPAGG